MTTSAIAQRVRRSAKDAEKLLAKRAPTRVLGAVPKTLGFVGETLVHRFTDTPTGGAAHPAMSAGFMSFSSIR